MLPATQPRRRFMRVAVSAAVFASLPCATMKSAPTHTRSFARHVDVQSAPPAPRNQSGIGGAEGKAGGKATLVLGGGGDREGGGGDSGQHESAVQTRYELMLHPEPQHGPTFWFGRYRVLLSSARVHSRPPRISHSPCAVARSIVCGRPFDEHRLVKPSTARGKAQLSHELEWS